MHPVELQGRIDRELKSLPALRAPDTLLPRVLAAVRHWADRPWYARAWFTWPMWWRVASAAALNVAVITSLFFKPVMVPVKTGLGSP